MTAKQEVDEIVDGIPMLPINFTVEISSDLATRLYTEFVYVFPVLEECFKYSLDSKTRIMQKGTSFFYRGITFKVS